MASECPRHDRLNYPGHRVVMCRHIGERFVVIHESTTGNGYTSVDYIEDLPDDGLVVEGTDWYGPDTSAVCRAWNGKVAKMMANVSPDQDRAYEYD